MSIQRRSGSARVNGNDIYYEDCGRGMPLVFIHGAFNTCDMWRPQVEAFSRRRRVIVYDLRGHGRSGPAQGLFSVGNLARDLDGLLSHLGAAPAVICGFSLGGCVAQEFAVRYPDKVQGLVISDSVGDSPAGPGRNLARGLLRFSAPFVSRRRLLDLARVATNSMRNDVREYFMEVAAENLRRMSKSEILGVALSLVQFQKQDLSRFDRPALVVVGAREPRRIRTEARRLAGRMARATLEVIENAQHGPNREDPLAFNAAIGRLVDVVETVDRQAA